MSSPLLPCMNPLIWVRRLWFVLAHTFVFAERASAIRFSYDGQLKEVPAERGSNDDDAVGRYRVLSYNICWGCMEANTQDISGMRGDLKRACMERTDQPGVPGLNGMGLNVTVCARNMGAAIAKYDAAIGGYDFIAFQEASNAGDLYLSQPGLDMAIVEHGEPVRGVNHHEGAHVGDNKKVWIASLYNKARLGLHDVAVPSNDRNGRPFLVLVFDQRKLIFINIHNDHISNGMKTWMAPAKDMETVLAEHFLQKPERKDYRVILAGDFNDPFGALPGCMKLPWNSHVLKVQSPLPATCCSTFLDSAKPWMSGDYIFDSASASTTNHVPSLYDASLAQSDHWPVEAVLAPDSSVKSESSARCLMVSALR